VYSLELKEDKVKVTPLAEDQSYVKCKITPCERTLVIVGQRIIKLWTTNNLEMITEVKLPIASACRDFYLSSDHIFMKH
jgi:hypothetical protein